MPRTFDARSNMDATVTPRVPVTVTEHTTLTDRLAFGAEWLRAFRAARYAGVPFLLRRQAD
jgi:hypothetical protein